MNETDSMLNRIFKIPYTHNRTPCLMSFNEEEHSLLINSLSTHQFQYLSLDSCQIYSIDYLTDEFLLNLDYSTTNYSFYFITRKTNWFVLFRLNQEIEIEREMKLINFKDHFIILHINENIILFKILIYYYVYKISFRKILNSFINYF